MLRSMQTNPAPLPLPPPPPPSSILSVFLESSQRLQTISSQWSPVTLKALVNVQIQDENEFFYSNKG